MEIPVKKLCTNKQIHLTSIKTIEDLHKISSQNIKCTLKILIDMISKNFNNSLIILPNLDNIIFEIVAIVFFKELSYTN